MGSTGALKVTGIAAELTTNHPSIAPGEVSRSKVRISEGVLNINALAQIGHLFFKQNYCVKIFFFGPLV